MADVSEDALANGRAIITKSLERIARKKFPDSEQDRKALVDATFANIQTTTDAQTAVQGTDLIVEAIVENIATKQALFRRSVARSLIVSIANADQTCHVAQVG